MTEGQDEVSDKNICTNSQPTGTTHQPDGKTRKDVNFDIETKSKNDKFISRIRWPDLTAQIFIHAGCVYGLYLCFYSRFYTSVFAFCTIYTSGFGITAGVHRLWSHRAYKANWPLRFFLVILFTITGQKHVYAWALDHRVHHKYTESDADPHNAKKGFWFAHVGWLFLTPHPDVVAKRKVVDMSDLEADPIVMWQKKYYPLLYFIFTIALPVAIPVYFWNERLWNSFWINYNTRYCITLNIAFCVNSVAHMWGQKPYDRFVNSVENVAVSVAALGEGWHNYHHVFPWDYKTGEFGTRFNLSTQFIDFFAWLGWAYDLKSATPKMIYIRAKKCGDGSHCWVHLENEMDKELFEDIELEEDEKQA